MNDNIQKIYTDGACRNNGTQYAKGGWAFVVSVNGVQTHADSGAITEGATNNVAELTAILKALEYCEKDSIIYTDSAYIQRCHNERWYKNWIRNGWQRRVKNSWVAVANKELWEQIIKLWDEKNISVLKVAGHSGDWFNEMADKLARQSVGN